MMKRKIFMRLVATAGAIALTAGVSVAVAEGSSAASTVKLSGKVWGSGTPKTA